MKNVKIFNYAFCILSIGILFAGCVISQNIKATPEAERVTYLQTIPNDCKFLGEIHAEAGGKELHTHYVNSLNEYNFKSTSPSSPAMVVAGMVMVPRLSTIKSSEVMRMGPSVP